MSMLARLQMNCLGRRRLSALSRSISYCQFVVQRKVFDRLSEAPKLGLHRLQFVADLSSLLRGMVIAAVVMVLYLPFFDRQVWTSAGSLDSVYKTVNGIPVFDSSAHSAAATELSPLLSTRWDPSNSYEQRAAAAQRGFENGQHLLVCCPNRQL
jgi:hypothetical protein